MFNILFVVIQIDPSCAFYVNTVDWDEKRMQSVKRDEIRCCDEADLKTESKECE